MELLRRRRVTRSLPPHRLSPGSTSRFARLLEDRVAEPVVDGPIGFPVAPGEVRPRVDDVAEGPKRRVGRLPPDRREPGLGNRVAWPPAKAHLAAVRTKAINVVQERGHILPDPQVATDYLGNLERRKARTGSLIPTW